MNLKYLGILSLFILVGTAGISLAAQSHTWAEIGEPLTFLKRIQYANGGFTWQTGTSPTESTIANMWTFTETSAWYAGKTLAFNGFDYYRFLTGTISGTFRGNLVDSYADTDHSYVFDRTTSSNPGLSKCPCDKSPTVQECSSSSYTFTRYSGSECMDQTSSSNYRVYKQSSTTSRQVAPMTYTKEVVIKSVSCGGGANCNPRVARLIHKNDGVCFLTRYSGDPRGFGEIATVYVEDNFWRLKVQHGSGDGIEAGARCFGRITGYKMLSGSCLPQFESDEYNIDAPGCSSVWAEEGA